MKFFQFWVSAQGPCWWLTPFPAVLWAVRQLLKQPLTAWWQSWINLTGNLKSLWAKGGKSLARHKRSFQLMPSKDLMEVPLWTARHVWHLLATQTELVTSAKAPPKQCYSQSLRRYGAVSVHRSGVDVLRSKFLLSNILFVSVQILFAWPLKSWSTASPYWQVRRGFYWLMKASWQYFSVFRSELLLINCGFFCCWHMAERLCVHFEIIRKTDWQRFFDQYVLNLPISTYQNQKKKKINPWKDHPFLNLVFNPNVSYNPLHVSNWCYTLTWHPLLENEFEN